MDRVAPRPNMMIAPASINPSASISAPKRTHVLVESILRAVRAQPGITGSDLSEKIGVPTYLVIRLLVIKGVLVYREGGLYLAKPDADALTKMNPTPVDLSAREAAQKILELVRQRPGFPSKRVSERIGINCGKIVMMLIDAGHVERIEGRLYARGDGTSAVAVGHLGASA